MATPKHIYYGKLPSPCHGSPTVIVKSQNGFVTQNCTTCGTTDRVEIETMPDYFYCPVCDKPVERVKRTKSMFECKRCRIKWELHTIVPEWSDLFP